MTTQPLELVHSDDPLVSTLRPLYRPTPERVTDLEDEIKTLKVEQSELRQELAAIKRSLRLVASALSFDPNSSAEPLRQV